MQFDTASPTLLNAEASETERRSELGQFFTEPHIASLMASMFCDVPEDVTLLDAGAGEGALTSAFVAHCCQNSHKINTIRATLFEIDSRVQERLDHNMQVCKNACRSVGIAFTYEIHHSDFILQIAERLRGGMFTDKAPQFSTAIANPPYRKLSSESKERLALRSIGIESTNLYSAFIALIQRLLKREGELVAITPRSFCNGPYFRPFRESLIEETSIQKIHLFDSRSAAFGKDSVLQENIIFHTVKSVSQVSHVTISSSSGRASDPVSSNSVPFQEVVDPYDKEKFIRIPSESKFASAKNIISNLTSSLSSLGITVSTGRVVDFRVKDYLRKLPVKDSVPLLYPGHFREGKLSWPLQASKKPNAIMVTESTMPWLVPRGTYLLTKRFTSKEERRRLVGYLLDADDYEADTIGIENHLNYFHRNGAGLPRELARGLYLFLNSTIVDDYFRGFSGHTQVNATDLRSMNYPNDRILRKLGELWESDMTQRAVDDLVSRFVPGEKL